MLSLQQELHPWPLLAHLSPCLKALHSKHRLRPIEPLTGQPTEEESELLARNHSPDKVSSLQRNYLQGCITASCTRISAPLQIKAISTANQGDAHASGMWSSST